jgi:prepilin-type N-terminal cleavage/methylation domain-containing protein
MVAHMRKKYQEGFTLIEMIVSLGIFAIVITMAVGALLVLIASNQRLQDEQGVMTNLSYAVDSMTRELRTGYGYFCAGVNSPTAAIPGGLQIFNDNRDDHEDLLSDDVSDCDPSSAVHDRAYRGVSFVEGGDSITGSSERILFYFFEDSTNPENSTIMRRVGDDPAQSVISSGLIVTDARFVVTGSEALSGGDTEQPTVTIYIEAEEVNDDTKKYRLQTTVTQRVLDL